MPALHAWRNQEDVPYQTLPHAGCPRQLFQQIESVRVLKDEMLVEEEKKIGGRQIPYILQGEMLMSN